MSTTCVGASRQNGSRQILGFVELDNVGGIYQGDVTSTPSVLKGINQINSHTFLNIDEHIDWEQYMDPGDLRTLDHADKQKAASKTMELLQQLQSETESKPEIPLIRNIQSLVEGYLTRGRHYKNIKYHVLVKFLQDCAPVGMSISNLGFKMIFDFPERKKDTLVKMEAFRASARPPTARP